VACACSHLPSVSADNKTDCLAEFEVRLEMLIASTSVARQRGMAHRDRKHFPTRALTITDRVVIALGALQHSGTDRALRRLRWSGGGNDPLSRTFRQPGMPQLKQARRRKPTEGATQVAWPTVIGMERPETEGSAEVENVLSVPAMTCRDCVRAVSGHLLDVAGVVTVQVDLRSRTIRVRGTPQLDAVLKAITDAGYKAVC
jgi:copper chaperone